MKSRAFLLEPCEFIVDDAARFGAVTRIFKHFTDHDLPVRPKFADQVLDRLGELNYNPDVDYIIVTGQLQSMVAMIAALVGEYGAVKTLVFDKTINGYAINVMGGLRRERRRSTGVR